MRHRAKINVRRAGHGRSLKESRLTHTTGTRAQQQGGKQWSQGRRSKDTWEGMGVSRHSREAVKSDSRI